METDKSINPKDLPEPRKDADTKQAEEFVDKSSIRKDEGDMPAKSIKHQEKDASGERNR